MNELEITAQNNAANAEKSAAEQMNIQSAKMRDTVRILADMIGAKEPARA